MFGPLLTLPDLLRGGGCSAPETGTSGGISTAAGGKDILGISAGAGAVIGVTCAVTCVAEADAAVADADPSSDCDAALS